MSETRLVRTEAEIRISADSHMAEPFDLWEKRMPENLRDRAQRYPNLRYGQGLHAREGGRTPEAQRAPLRRDTGPVAPGVLDDERHAEGVVSRRRPLRP